MKDFVVKSKFLNYKISFLKKNSFSDHLYEICLIQDIIIIDEIIFKLYKKYFKNFKKHKIVLLKATEKNKSFSNLNNIIVQLINHGITRKTRLIAIGGGIIQDIVCFISSTIFRGVNWIFYPTTLLAQADSCIGSKSSINFQKYKNLIGTYHPPLKINIDISFLNTLSKEEIHSGIGEILKVYIIAQSKKIIELSKIVKNDLLIVDNLKPHINESLKIKKKIIESDEFDKNTRKILNYGHSFGHSIESATNYKIPHGIAVTIGMDIANYISNFIGNLDYKKYLLYKDYLSANAGKFYNADIDQKKMISALSKDKKNIDNKNFNLILWSKKNSLIVQSIKNDNNFKKILNSYFISRNL